MPQQNAFGYSDNQQAHGSVECLGMTFENDDARRKYFVQKLREKLQDPAFRQIEGFPIGSDEDILALSDPPYYTACPNPFIADFIAHYGTPYDPTVPYSNEPFAADVSEGKNDPIYNAHSYHTKVPHKAIMRYILHYTKSGDIVLDGFCGTGMTGVAAQMCGNPDPEFKLQIEQEWNATGWGKPEWGKRRAILSDLSPVATFIAYNYNTPVDVIGFEREAKRILAKVETECGWMYETAHTDGTKARINYTVWSEVFTCPNCSQEIVFLEESLNQESGQVNPVFPCPYCNVNVSKRRMARAFEAFYDSLNGITSRCVKRIPVLINYTYKGQKYQKKPDTDDIECVQRVEQTELSNFFPSLPLPYMHISHIKDKMSNFGISHFSHFFLPRQQHALASLWNAAHNSSQPRIRHALLFMVEQTIMGLSILNRYQPIQFGRVGGSQVNRHMSGVLYVPSQIAEVSPWYALDGKLKRLVKVLKLLWRDDNNVFVSLNSGGNNPVPDCSVDYIFTDPPFGNNLQYSELNWFVEAFHRLLPDNTLEAVINKAQRKDTPQYMDLMLACFKENYRVLKPGRWMTVEFHNSKNSIWNAIQEAMLRAGFIVADTRILDKQGETYKQSLQGVVKADLVISAYKPTSDFEERFRLDAGTEEGVWDFVRTHLRQLPIFVQAQNGQGQVIAERQGYLLYDRMVAFHVQRNVSVPLSASEFQAGLTQRFPPRDDMYFLPEQVAEYERKRMTIRDIQQLQVFVSDESSAIQWIRQQLINKPQTIAELTPQFMQELRSWQKHEAQVEMADLLEQNFLRYDGNSPIPAQIVAWLKKSAEMRDLLVNTGRELDDGSVETDNQQLKTRARDRWYVPDPNKAIDLDNLRKKALLREFNTYVTGRGNLKQFRTEAIRAGFSQAYNQKEYATIVSVAERLPESVLQEDPTLLMYYDTANLRV